MDLDATWGRPKNRSLVRRFGDYLEKNDDNWRGVVVGTIISSLIVIPSIILAETYLTKRNLYQTDAILEGKSVEETIDGCARNQINNLFGTYDLDTSGAIDSSEILEFYRREYLNDK